MKQTFVSYTSRRASSNCHILIWITMTLEEPIWAAATPLEVRLLPAWQVSWVSSTPWLSLVLSLSLALSLTHTLSLPSSLTLYYHFQTHTLSLCHFHWLCIVDRYCCPSLNPTLYLHLSVSLALDQDTVGRCDSVSVEGVTTWMFNGVIEVMRKGETDIGTSCVCETAAHS
jgi:hypothetical protein